MARSRARQVLLVGDEKQLPPTRFFAKLESDAPATDDDDGEGADLGRDMESILGLGMVRMPHRFSLRLPGASTVVRYRGDGCEVTKPELIPPEEYEEAIRLVRRKEFGLHPEALHSSVVGLMGFERAGERLKDELARAVQRLIATDAISIDARGYVVLAR